MEVLRHEALARAVLAKNGDEFARLNREVDLVNDMLTVKLHAGARERERMIIHGVAHEHGCPAMTEARLASITVT